MDPEQIQQFRQFYQQHYYQILVGCFVFGVILGSIPFFFGLRRGKRNLGIIAFIVTIIDSVIWLPLGLITAIVFTVIIIVQKTAPKESDSSSDNLE
jgi:uncharacterized membrane protein affecting hemolysin expression